MVCTRTANIFKGFKKCTFVPDRTYLEALLDGNLLVLTLTMVILTIVLIFEAHHQMTKTSRAPPGYVILRPDSRANSLVTSSRSHSSRASSSVGLQPSWWLRAPIVHAQHCAGTALAHAHYGEGWRTPRLFVTRAP